MTTLLAPDERVDAVVGYRAFLTGAHQLRDPDRT
jgi:hypothetical protein